MLWGLAVCENNEEGGKTSYRLKFLLQNKFSSKLEVVDAAKTGEFTYQFEMKGIMNSHVIFLGHVFASRVPDIFGHDFALPCLKDIVGREIALPCLRSFYQENLVTCPSTSVVLNADGTYSAVHQCLTCVR